MTDAVPEPRPPERVAIIGAGTMGTGMALAFAAAGSTVQMTARHEETLAHSRSRQTEILAMLADHKLVERAATKDIAGRISLTTSFQDLVMRGALVIETIIEDTAVKRDVLTRAERQGDDATIITTNTSSLPLSELSEVLQRPDRFAGYHWFNPPELVKLVEIVMAPKTADETVRRLSAWSLAVGKQPVVLRREIEGFVANRLQYALVREAYALVERGVCDIEDVDRVITAGLGPRWAAVGPFEAMDLAGLDIHHAVARRLFPVLDSSGEPPSFLGEMVADGLLGAKSGRGLRGTYDPESVRRLAERRIAVLLAVEGAMKAEAGEAGG